MQKWYNICINFRKEGHIYDKEKIVEHTDINGMHRKYFLRGGARTLTADAANEVTANTVISEENTVITELGTYEVQLNYNSEVELTFTPSESGNYGVRTTSEGGKFHRLGLLTDFDGENFCSSTSTYWNACDLRFDELTAGEKTGINLSSIADLDDEYESEYYNWTEGETDTITLEIYKIEVIKGETITEPGKYEVQLNYNSEVELTFIPSESGKYIYKSASEGRKFYVINGSSSSSYSVDKEFGELTAGEEYTIYISTIADSSSEFDTKYYNWTEGETDTLSLEIYKVDEKEIEFADLEGYTVSAGTLTYLTFSVENPTDIIIDNDYYGIIWLEYPDGSMRGNAIDGIFCTDQPGTYTLKFENISDDVVLHFLPYNDYGCNEIFHYKKYDDSVTLKSLHNYVTLSEIEIPGEIDGLPVTCIEELGLVDSIISVIIPDSVTTIGECAFFGSESLKNITIPDSVTSIGRQAFSYCRSLKNIVIPESVTYIGAHQFLGSENLESVTIENPECTIYNFASTICNGETEDGEYYFNGTIYGYTNSTAEEYAKTYGYKFESIGVYTPEILKGDANGDGKISASDSAFIAKLIAKASLTGDKVSVEEYPNADYNGDGKISAQDAALIAKYVAEQALKK